MADVTSTPEPVASRRGSRPLRIAIVLVLVLGIVTAALAVFVRDEEGGNKHPNIVLVVTDDSHYLEHDIVADMRPNGGFAWIRDHGLEFNRMWSTDNVCCPGRTTILTGQTAFNHHILEANTSFKVIANALPTWLQKAGYDTGFSGRYLNLYPVVYKSKKFARPPGWTYWEPLVDNILQETGYVAMGRDGKVGLHQMYVTDYLSRQTRRQLDDSLRQGKPAFVSLWPLAPHVGADPKPTYADVPVDWKAPDPSYLEADTSDKPPGIRKVVKEDVRQADLAAGVLREAARQVRTLLSVDDAVKSIIGDLRDRDQLDNTVFILTSDNGYLLGEHSIDRSKEYAFEAAQMPFWIAGPGFRPGAKSDAFVTNLDIAPTIARIAGASTDGASIDGRPIQDILADPHLGRERFLPLFVPNVVPKGEGVKTWRYKYIRYRDGAEELYDLAVDPYELGNKADDPKYERIKGEMQQLMQRAVKCKGAGCQVPAPRQLQGASMSYPDRFRATGRAGGN
jgi:N-acetylglucosamine-6-sulfatase